MSDLSNEDVTGSNGEQNGNVKRDRKLSGPLIRSPFRAMVQDFGPLWFTWCMNAGIIAILLHQHPYRFNGINILSCIFFAFDFGFFFIFAVIFALRLIMFPRQSWNELTNDVASLCLLACPIISWLTICDLIALIISTAYWGRYWATLTAYVLWWIAVGMIFAIIFFYFIILTRRKLMEPSPSGDSEKDIQIQVAAPMPTLIIIPAVGVSTTALTGAIIITYGYGATVGMAIPAIIMGFVLVGISILMGMVLVTLLWYGVLIHGFPAPEMTTSLFVFIGPLAQSASALLALGTAASEKRFFERFNRGEFFTASSASALSAACTLIALLLLGTAVFFLFFSIYVMVERAVLKQLKWTMSWNSIIFPWGTLATATTLLSVALDSSTFAILTSIQLIILIIVFLVNLAFTVTQIAKGQLLIVREDPRIKKEIEEMQKEK